MSDQRLVRANGVDVACELDGRGEPVVFIHGLGSSRADWQRQRLPPARFRTLRYDLRGHGASSRPAAGYDLPTLAADAAALVEALDLGPVHVVGLSLGGMVGLQLALDRPPLVRSLTVVNSGPEVVGETARERRQLALRLLLTRTLGPRWLGKLLARRLFPRPEHATYARQFAQQMARNDRRVYLLTTLAIFNWSVVPRLPELACPVLVVSGDRDYTPVERKRAWAAQIPDARVEVVADSGHATPLDQPEAFAATLLRFLEAQRATPAARSSDGVEHELG